MEFIKKNISKIPKKDRNTLIGLVVFLVLAGYYQFIFEPLYQKNKRLTKDLYTKEEQLLKLKMKIREWGSWQRDKERFSAKIAEMNHSILMPSSDKDLSEVVQAIMRASKGDHIQMTNLRPIKRTLEDGITQVIDTFSLDGFTRAENFITFMERLWGIKVEEVHLSKTGNKKKPIKFYMKISLLTPGALETIKSDITEGKNLAVFNLLEDPFYPKRKPVKKKLLKPKKPKPKPVKVVKLSPPAPRIDLSESKLVGIATHGNKEMAMVTDERQQKLLFLSPGDTFRGYTVSSIDDKGINFMYLQEVTSRLQLPNQGKIFPGMQAIRKKLGVEEESKSDH